MSLILSLISDLRYKEKSVNVYVYICDKSFSLTPLPLSVVNEIPQETRNRIQRETQRERERETKGVTQVQIYKERRDISQRQFSSHMVHVVDARLFFAGILASLRYLCVYVLVRVLFFRPPCPSLSER